jgi:hypothetical protein
MKTLKTSTPLRIDTIGRPYDVHLEIHTSRPPSQYKKGNEYDMDRSAFPVILTPALVLANPDDGSSRTANGADSTATPYWYLVTPDGSEDAKHEDNPDWRAVTKHCTAITNSMDGFCINQDNSLTVTRNGAFRIRLVMKYADLTAIEMITSAELEFGCDDVADSRYRLDIEDATRHFDPLKPAGCSTYAKAFLTRSDRAVLTDGETHLVFHANAYFGAQLVTDTSTLYFQWLVDVGVVKPSYMPIDDDETLCIGYVKGQGTADLVIDADMAERLDIQCRLYLASDTERLKMIHFATATLRHCLPSHLNLDIIGARNVHNNNNPLVYRTQPRIGHKAITSAKALERIVPVWTKKTFSSTGTPTEVTVMGPSMQATGKELSNTTRGARVSVGAGILSAFRPLVDDNGRYIIQDKASASEPSVLIIGRA